jgi:RHS repeat-associated protein
MGLPRDLDFAAVTLPVDQQLVWDAANNLVAQLDHRDPLEWPAGYRPQSVSIRHDALYRVIGAELDYTQADGRRTPVDTATDWRDDFATTRPHDPMRQRPAEMVSALPSGRVASLTWSWDYLANTTEWTDDQSSFYERSLGRIVNGDNLSSTLRPSALYLASNIGDGTSPLHGGSGWVEVDYGVGGNVASMTVHSQCGNATGATCADTGSDLAARRQNLRANCVCAVEQHYVYRWDELNRLAEARRYDREALGWQRKVRQRYRYDGANQRTVKQTLEDDPLVGVPAERIALYVYPGDFERRGLVRGELGYEAEPALGTETQYVVAGARTVWKHAPSGTGYDRDSRFTVALTDLIQTTAAVLDVRSGELLEASTYYPNGARETYRVDASTATAPEVTGFTSKEGDEEVGVVYFGERYLIPRLGRWASPDPLHVHQVGGGEGLNSYHYVAGSLLAARDPLGLDASEEVGEAARHIQSVVDRHGASYNPSGGSSPAAEGVRLHGRVAAELDRADAPSNVRDRIFTECVIDPEGHVVAHGPRGGPQSIGRLRHDPVLIARIRDAGQASQYLQTTQSGRTMIRGGYFRTVDVLIATGDISDVRAMRSRGIFAARGRVVAVDVKFNTARLEGTLDLLRRLHTIQVAARPGGSVLGGLRRAAARLARALSVIADVAGHFGLAFTAIELGEIPERATAVSEQILAEIERGVLREQEVLHDLDERWGRGLCRSGPCNPLSNEELYGPSDAVLERDWDRSSSAPRLR